MDLRLSWFIRNFFNQRKTATSDFADRFTKLLCNLTIEFSLFHGFAPFDREAKRPPADGHLRKDRPSVGQTKKKRQAAT